MILNTAVRPPVLGVVIFVLFYSAEDPKTGVLSFDNYKRPELTLLLEYYCEARGFLCQLGFRGRSNNRVYDAVFFCFVSR